MSGAVRFPASASLGRLAAELRLPGGEQVTTTKGPAVTPELLQTQKLAELGLMSSALLHELKQPLMGIKGFAQLLQEGPGREKAEQILAQVERLEQLIASHRRFLHADASRTEQVELRQVVNDALEVLGPRLRASGATLESELPEAPVRVPAVAPQLTQILLNLLSNALDAVAQAGSSRIRLRLTAQSGTAELLIADDGPGIPPHVAEQLFAPFFTTKGPEKGTGLGLFISRSLAESNGATLELVPPSVARIDAKTVFRLRFGEPKFDPQPVPARKTVLVVDDEEVVRSLISELLQSEPLDLQFAETGDAALQLLAKRTFDLVLTDKNLPGATGLEIARAVRQRSSTCPVILMTGYPSLETAQEGLAIGLIDYLEKPFDDIGLVRKRIREALQGTPPPSRPVEKVPNRRVLVIEDRNHDAMKIAEATTMAGGIATVVGTLADAMRQLETGGAAGVILSLDLRDKELTPAGIRELKRKAGGAVVTLCDHPTLEQTVAAIRMGASVCLPRALASPQALSKELKKLLTLA